MTGYGRRIKELRKAAHLTQTEVADALNMSQRTVAHWECENREPGMDAIAALAQLFGASTEYIISGIQNNNKSDDAGLPLGLVKIKDMPHHYIPMLGKVAAGVPLFMEVNYDCYVDSAREADFALTVSGDSMSPTYLDGDVVYIRAVQAVDDGQICVVAVDDSATLKHLYRIKGGVQLVSDNHAYPPMIYTGEDCDSIRVLGIPVGFTRMYKRGGNNV